jgi:hypothetical protein
VKRINATLAGWVNYFRVGNSSRAFSEVRDYVEMKVRTLLTRQKRRRKGVSAGGDGVTNISTTFWGCTGTGKSSRYPALGRGSESAADRQDS